MILINLAADVKEWIVDLHRRSTDACVRRRAAIVLDLADGPGATETSRRQRVARTTVYDVHRLWVRRGIAALFDGRSGNCPVKADEAFRRRLGEVVAGRPFEYGRPRPTWTLELLALVMHRKTGVLVSTATISRLLDELGARRGRPRPVAPCPWPRAKREARIAELKRLPESLPPDEDGFHEDEVDVHLNPKIGLDWMMPGQQKIVVTPGKNEKRHLAGALDARTGRLICVEGAAKTSALFVTLLWTLFRNRRRGCRRLHLILDNYGIHKSRMVEQALEAFGGRVVLHFLPPYCPEANPIERVWRDLHADVTRNLRRRTMNELMTDVRDWIERRNAALNPKTWPASKSTSRSALESCKPI